MKIPKFTFDDWLGDRLKGKEFTVLGDNSLVMILGIASKDPEILTKEDYLKIRQCQTEVYDMALEMSLKAYKENYLKESGRVTDTESYLKLETAKIEQQLTKDLQLYQRAVTGSKDTAGITGKTYKRVKDLINQLKEDGLIFINILESRVFPYSLNAKYLDWLKKQAKGKTGNKEKELIFGNLFKPPYNTEGKIKDLKTLLKTAGYIEGSGEWIGLTKSLNELATLYHYFSDKGMLTSQRISPSIVVFYKEFGLIVDRKKENSVYTVTKNLTRHPGQTESYEEFERLFKNWIK